jgi:hypothetical protein
MKGKSKFTTEEADQIEQLIKKKLAAGVSEQKSIRNKIRRLGFYASDFGIGGGYTVDDFRRVAVIEVNYNKNNFLSKKEYKLEKEKKPFKSKKTEKDETLFFSEFNELLGEEWFLSKSIQKPISSAAIFLSDDFRDYAFPKSIENNFEELLEALKSNYSFSSKSLSHYIDGLIKNHPLLGSRIVEFDEEQHFTPAFRQSMMVQSKTIDQKFSKFYLEILSDVNYLNDEVLKKHRIKSRFKEFPNNNQFLEAIENEKVSGYIKPKKAFDYLGGRMSQRAYYDCLRNAAHLSSKNTELQPILRFPKKFFEDATNKKFGTIEKEQLKELIAAYLKNVYSLDIKNNTRG